MDVRVGLQRKLKAEELMLLNCGFELWTLESPLDNKEIQPVHPKGSQPEYWLKGLMVKLKLQYFGPLMWRTDSSEKTLMLGKTEGGRRRGWQRMSWLDAIIDSWTWVWVSSKSWWWTGKPGMLWSMRAQRIGHGWATNTFTFIRLHFINILITCLNAISPNTIRFWRNYIRS